MNGAEPATTSHNSNEAPGEGPIRWAGVDWSWPEDAVCVIDDSGAAIERFAVTHTTPGLSTLVTALQCHQITGVAIERGDGPVVAALLDAGLTSTAVPAPGHQRCSRGPGIHAVPAGLGAAGRSHDRIPRLSPRLLPLTAKHR
ncbi:IS110 family transposase [Pseudonocardia endophytica]|uniref:IS110 family transposase n=1 Tax=Pseudonocardia endophytica TaxID=401976 RepID=UPI00104EF559|nr:transposase [Pseudonocardia endophytica]